MQPFLAQQKSLREWYEGTTEMFGLDVPLAPALTLPLFVLAALLLLVVTERYLRDKALHIAEVRKIPPEKTSFASLRRAVRPFFGLLLVYVLAEALLPGEETHTSTQLLGFSVPYPPDVVVPSFVVSLGLVLIVIEIVLGSWLRALAKRTKTQLDDVILDGIRGLIRPVVSLVGIHVIAQALLGGESERVASRVIVILAIVVMSWKVAALLLRLTDEWVHVRPRYLPLGPPIKLGLKLVFVPVVGLMVLQTLEIEILPLLSVLGIGSLAIALALKDTLANLFAGIQLVIDQPIRGGDFIEIDANIRGFVHEIGLRSTRIRSLDNNMIVVPNSLLATTIVKNNDAFDRTYAHRFYVGVAYDSDSRHVQRVLEEVCELAGNEVEGLIPAPPSVRFVEFGPSALTFRMEVKLKQFDGRRKPLGEVHHRIHARLAEEGIEIPFPMRTVVLRREGGAPADEAAE
jgi:small-conductance mechanosensitive channel